MISFCVASVMIFANGKVHGEKVELFIEDYGQNVAVAVSKNGSAVILGEVSLYEKGLLTSQLEDKGISVSGTVLSDGKIYLQNEADGKILTIGERIELYNDVVAEKSENGILLQVCEKYIYIFSSESLQYDSNCDIIIRLSESDAFVRIGKKSFSSKKEDGLIFTFTEDNFVLRGGTSWLNLMKSN